MNAEEIARDIYEEYLKGQVKEKQRILNALEQAVLIGGLK